MADETIILNGLTKAEGDAIAETVQAGGRYPNLATAAGLGDLTIDAWGNQKVTQPISLFHGLWTFNIPLTMWFMFENGTQVYSSTDIISDEGIAKLTTTVTNTNLILESRECPRYQPNRGHLFSTALIAPNKTNDGVRDWGLFNSDDGVFFRLKADGLLYAVLRRGGVEVLEELIDTSDLTGFDVEKNNIYDIQFQWRSAGNYKFFIGNPATGTSKLVHEFNLLGTLTTASMENPTLPVCFEIERTTQDVALHVGCADITSEGGITDKEQYGSAYAENVNVSTNTPVIVVYNPLTAESRVNTRTITLARITAICSKKGSFKVWTTRDPAAITGETLVAVNSGSYVETDSPDRVAGAVRATSVNTSLLNPITLIPVEAAKREFVDNPFRGRIEFPLVRGDYLVVTCTAATATADCVVEWGEQV